MRWTDLFESVARYRPMYNGIAHPIQDSDITDYIQRVEHYLQRQDRIIWFLRWHRLWYAYKVNDRLFNEVTGDLDEDYDRLAVPDKTLQKYKQAVGLNPQMYRSQAMEAADDVMGMLLAFKHFVDMGVHSMNAIVWDRQTPKELEDEMVRLEEEWRERLDSCVEIQRGDEKLIDFHNGWAWWKLDRATCRQEADAMGHCGNAGGYYTDRILSLRKHIEDDFWEPHLTFIISAEGALGEMKSRANEKPAPRYHSAIVALLRNDIVTDIVGGGYMPENNFSLNDLDHDVVEQLKKEKPELRDIYDLYREWLKMKETGKFDKDIDAGFKRKLEGFLSAIGSYRSIDYKKGEITIDVEPLSVFQYNDDLTRTAYSFFENLEDIIAAETPSLQDVDPDALADHVRHDHATEIYSVVVGAGLSYHLSVYHVYDPVNETVTKKVDISEVVNADDDIINAMCGRGLDEAYDSNTEWDWVEASTPLGEVILDYIKDECEGGGRRQHKNRGDAREVVMHILAEYGIGLQRNVLGSPTIKDPNQYEFDFPKKSD